MTLGVFRATVRQCKPHVQGDEAFRAFLDQFEGETVELYIRRPTPLYDRLPDTMRRAVREFITTFQTDEAAFFMLNLQNGYDTMDIVRHIAHKRHGKTLHVPDELVRLFALDNDFDWKHHEQVL